MKKLHFNNYFNINLFAFFFTIYFNYLLDINSYII